MEVLSPSSLLLLRDDELKGLRMGYARILRCYRWRGPPAPPSLWGAGWRGGGKEGSIWRLRRGEGWRRRMSLLVGMGGLACLRSRSFYGFLTTPLFFFFFF